MCILNNSASSEALANEFDRWWHSQGSWVEPANQRRNGESGVQLLPQRDPTQPPLYCKRQIGHTYCTLRHPFGRPTIVRELQAYRAFASIGIGTPRLIYAAARRSQGQWQALLVTEALRDFVNLEQWYAGNPDSESKKTMLYSLALTLTRLHIAGWQHGCCYAKHIFVKTFTNEGGEPQAEIALIDMEKSRRRLRAKNASRHDLGQLARHRGNMPEADLMFVHRVYRQIMNNPPMGLSL
jgi:hypothetical protein